MAEHPIDSLMKTAMASIKEMVNVNTVVGDAVETPDGTVIIPVSRVSLGFAAGGGDFAVEDRRGEERPPGFGGGSGAGVSVVPIGFLVAGQGNVRLLPVDGNAIYDRLVDLAPQIVSQIQELLGHNHDRVEDVPSPSPPPPTIPRY
ncbi:MAG: GerW family sporulation protein [Peptococcaceae bacterium]|nr:GerW family sporulation protein [Peptococcaceae bacterium]